MGNSPGTTIDMKTETEKRYNTLSNYLRSRFGQRVQKIPLDAGFSCPNRDGTISRRGCAFCNPEGSGTGLGGSMDLAGQWNHWRERLRKRYKATLFMAYLQSYSNTHGPLERIRRVLAELEGLPALAGLSMGTRPDCLDPAKLDCIAAFPAEEIHLELGLQTANNETLRRINRGHGAACFAAAARMAAERGIKVVAHLMAGLPGETDEDFLKSVDFVSGLPVHGVKLHNLYLCRGTALAQEFARGTYQPLTLQEYAGMTARAIARLRPDMVVHRLNGDPAPGELVAPGWASEKQRTLQAIHDQLEARGLRQGMNRRAS